GLGPKKVKAIHDELGIETLDALRQACEAGQVAKLKGFGDKTQDKILEGIAFLGQAGNRVPIDDATAVGELILGERSKVAGVVRAALCGSIRRRRESAKDIDLVASSKDPGPVMDAFVALPQVAQVLAYGETKSSVVVSVWVGSTRVMMNCDLRVVSDEQFP